MMGIMILDYEQLSLFGMLLLLLEISTLNFTVRCRCCCIVRTMKYISNYMSVLCQYMDGVQSRASAHHNGSFAPRWRGLFSRKII
jgi:hypothetical protein